MAQSVDFAFAWEGATAEAGPFAHLEVVRFDALEELSALARYELTLIAKGATAEVDPQALVGSRATFRMTTQTTPAYRVVHGILTEAEELAQHADGILYRVVLQPPLARARYRKRSRIFLDKTIRQVVETVLTGDPLVRKSEEGSPEADAGDESYQPAAELFEWRASASPRIDQVQTRPYIVQYNESDLDFVARLLEDEGLSFHYEHGREKALLVLSDSDSGRSRLEPFTPIGPGIDGREVETFKLGARLRSRSVKLGEFNWKQPSLDMTAETSDSESPSELVEVVYPGGYAETPALGKPIADAMLDRYSVEAEYALGEGTCRALFAGAIFTLASGRPRHEGEYLVTRLRARGEQAGALSQTGAPASRPFTVHFEVARRGKDGVAGESRFRPSKRTPRPRIVGSQTAFVTAEPSAPGAEIHVGGPQGGEIGCVRLRFHWDREEKRLAKEPSSTWVRVSQLFAGAGEGAVWHPRVGTEVIVEYEEGDPDRPLVTGRVYNGRNRPPAPSVGSPTVSTFHSKSSPGGAKFNEVSFDDAAGAEKLTIHAAKDWNSDIGNDRSENIANNSSSNVGVDASTNVGSNSTTNVGANSSTSVGANSTLSVGANSTESVGANHAVSVGVSQVVLVGASQTVNVGADQSITVGAGRTESIGAAHSVTVAAAQSMSAGAAQSFSAGAAQSVTAAGPQTVSSTAGPQTVSSGSLQTVHAGAAQNISAGALQTLSAPNQTFTTGGAQTLSAATFDSTGTGTWTAHSPTLVLDGATTNVNGSSAATVAAPTVTLAGDTVSIGTGAIGIQGSGVSIDGGGSTILVGPGSIEMTAGVIKLN